MITLNSRDIALCRCVHFVVTTGHVGCETAYPHSATKLVHLCLDVSRVLRGRLELEILGEGPLPFAMPGHAVSVREVKFAKPSITGCLVTCIGCGRDAIVAVHRHAKHPIRLAIFLSTPRTH